VGKNKFHHFFPPGKILEKSSGGPLEKILPTPMTPTLAYWFKCWSGLYFCYPPALKLYIWTFVYRIATSSERLKVHLSDKIRCFRNQLKYCSVVGQHEVASFHKNSMIYSVFQGVIFTFFTNFLSIHFECVMPWQTFIFLPLCTASVWERPQLLVRCFSVCSFLVLFVCNT